MATPPRPFWHTLLPDGKPVAVNDLADDESCRRVGVLVIGCGLTGASAAYHLSQKLGSEVLVVDARDLADGATGRNGGHQWAEVAESGDEVGARHARIEAADIAAVEAFVNTLNETERSPLELHRTGGVHFSMDEKEAPFLRDFAEKSAQEFLDGKAMREQEVISPLCKEAHANGFVVPGAGQLVPGHLVLALVSKARAHGVRVQTKCKVTSIARNEASNSGWIVELESPKGPIKIEAEQIIHASNAYGHELLPERLRGFCRGVRGQCIAAVATDEGARGPVVAPRSLTFESCAGSHEEYLIQRAGDDKMIIFGGCRHVATDEGEPFSHEGEPEEQVTEALVKGLERIFPDARFRVCHAWTGLMCFTQDGRPLVGPLQESAGQFVALGFGGHGMVRTFTCGRAISSLVLQAREGTKKSSISPEDTEILDFFAVDRVPGAPTCSSSTND